MSERRGKGPQADRGARTRRSDHGDGPQSVQDWMTTFQLRWIEHLGSKRHSGERRAPA
jgi:hypothetical protein